MKTRFFIILLLFGYHLASAHPVHISIVNMDVGNDSVNFSVRLFYDDFEHLINYKYNTFLDFRRDSRLTTKEQNAIQDYVNSTLFLQDDKGSVLTAKFTGWKIEGYSVWLFFSALPVKAVKNFKIENKLMLDLFDDQKNLMILNLYGKEQGIEFNKRTTMQHFSSN